MMDNVQPKTSMQDIQVIQEKSPKYVLCFGGFVAVIEFKGWLWIY